MLFNYLERGFLEFGHLSTYAFIMLFGYFFLPKQRTTYAHLLILTCFTTIYNFWLKHLFQIPLPATLMKAGWAFPSGHMHASMVFWGWLIINIRTTWLRLLMVCIIPFHAWALCHAGYHVPTDILGALGFGALTLLIYTPLTRRVPFNQGFLGLSLTLIGGILMLYSPHAFFVWQSIGLLAGFSIGWTLALKRTPTIASSWQKNILMLVGFLAVSTFIWYGFLSLSLPTTFLFFTLPFFCIGLWLGICPIAFSGKLKGLMIP